MIDPTPYLTAIGGVVIAVGAWLVSASRTRRNLSSDSVAVRTDQAEKGVISRLERHAADLDAENKRLAGQVQQLIESRAADVGVQAAKMARLEAQIAELSAKRDQWKSAYRRLAEESDKKLVALTAPSDYAPLDEAKQ
jgi:vacuolar-type H+-ATPase subunit I/STV1